MATGELTAEVVEEVAVNLEEAAGAVRRLDTKSLGFLFGGICIGFGIGFFIGYRYNREKLRAEAFRASEEEVEKIRDIYRESRTVVALEKPSVEELVEEKGYGPTEEVVRPLPPPVPIHEIPPTEKPEEPPEEFEPEAYPDAKDKNSGWNFPYELSQRSPNKPYIIHQDEFFDSDTGYQHVTYTYYEKDDVLADEDETVLHNRHNLIGPAKHLTRFGHGADDKNVLYIRNTHLELEIEVIREHKAYEEEVQGLEDETGRDDSESA